MQDRQPRTVLELVEWSVHAVSSSRHLERHGLVELHRSPKAPAPSF